MAKLADRYTVLIKHISELPETLEAIAKLKLKYFCINERADKENEVRIFVFFDNAGMDNYLSKAYDSQPDDIRKVLRRHEAGELTDIATLEAIREILHY